MMEQTGCDAVIVGRAAQGNPWIFAQIKAILDGAGDIETPTPFERIQMARRHARILNEREGRNIVRMRKHAMWYVAGMPGASKARGLFNSCTSLEEFEEVFAELLELARCPL